jgi:hypothetical protein
LDFLRETLFHVGMLSQLASLSSRLFSQFTWQLSSHFQAFEVIFWLKDESLEGSANLPDPDVIAQETAEGLQVALDQFESILGDLQS